MPAGALLCSDPWVHSQPVGGRKPGKGRTQSTSFRVPQPGCPPKWRYRPAWCSVRSFQTPRCSDNLCCLMRQWDGLPILVKVLPIFCISAKTSNNSLFMERSSNGQFACAACFLVGTCLIHTSQPAHWQITRELLSHHRPKLGTWRSLSSNAFPLLWFISP